VSEEERREETYADALQQLFDLTDAYFAQKGRFPSLVRVGASFGQAILKAGASRGLFPYFPVEIDETLEPNEIVIDDDPQPPSERERAGGGTAREKILPQIVDIMKHRFKDTPYGECYVGVTSDINRRLFREHKVSRRGDTWIAVLAASPRVAREVTEFFLDAGMDGDLGSGDETTTIVYAYRKNCFTEP
jgi:hypothetical protein